MTRLNSERLGRRAAFHASVPIRVRGGVAIGEEGDVLMAYAVTAKAA